MSRAEMPEDEQQPEESKESVAPLGQLPEALLLLHQLLKHERNRGGQRCA